MLKKHETEDEGRSGVDLNSMTDELLLKIFDCVDFKTKHNSIPLVCQRWSVIANSNDLWDAVSVDPTDEFTVVGRLVNQSKVFQWCSRPLVRVKELKLSNIGLDCDDFTPVGMGALFGICNVGLVRLEIHATRDLLMDLSSLLCLINIEHLSVSCIDPDPHNPFHGQDVQCISGLRKLVSLTLDINLVLVPGDLTTLQKLTSFAVNGTGSIALIMPDELSGLQSLERLTVKEPLWPEAPQVVYELTSLRSLHIEGQPQYSHNLGLSSGVTRMVGLEHLGIVAHRLQRAPEEIGEMSFLRDLDLSRNNFDERLPVNVMLPVMRLTRLESLNLSDCGFKRIPRVLSSLVSLHLLDLSGNPFVEISDALCNMHNLRVLLLKSCGLESVPRALCNIPRLEHIDLSNNNITGVENVKELVLGEDLRSLVLRQDRWTPELVKAACNIARIWGIRNPIVS
ncbi:hypothetical protein BSKO_11557 [Bryopsis sp. KO-2023]|nr:hypothetical protein BSKO_11557 [Bryopsis sp. KO-2023]